MNEKRTERASYLTVEDSQKLAELAIAARATARRAALAGLRGDPSEAYVQDDAAWDAFRSFLVSLERAS